ncbi:hypothetical protein OG455_05500 [Kitasatospora sp. NBC_01287]|uniref:hypothetical protein n=1 Tax=Kitasatospora sp. NBC_01287 TaxID=2903573 RepID=UPI0022546DD7|nr:hypothetical protein [Kitasatospora sp. NBC_01287]MCX4744983.1 hypothetical protein [Kitasatospora sp. NBC_01287]
MKLLPLDNAHRCAFELILARPRSERYMLERLAQDGAVALTFTLSDGPHLLKLAPNAPRAPGCAPAVDSMTGKD